MKNSPKCRARHLVILKGFRALGVDVPPSGRCASGQAERPSALGADQRPGTGGEVERSTGFFQQMLGEIWV